MSSAIVSAPALAAALQSWRLYEPFPPWHEALAPHALPPMYRLPAGSVADEVQSATRLVGEVAERLRRLKRAYGEWRVFEPGPYFDLTPMQVALLTRVVERAATVHVIFFVDALLPTFQTVHRYAYTAHRYTAHRYATQQIAVETSGAEHDETIYTTLAGHWQHMLEVINGVRAELRRDIGFLAFSGAVEEQARWERVLPGSSRNPATPWASTPASALPTLTLSVDFPMPAFRQPGRKRRLMRTWQRLYHQRASRTIR